MMRVYGAIVVAVYLALVSCGEEAVFEPLPGDDQESFQVEGEWTGRAVLPEPLVAPAAAVHDGWIYVVGGYADTGAGTATRHVLRFDPETLDVENLSDFGDRIAKAAMAVYRDTLVVIGGNSGHRSDVAIRGSVLWYDPDTDSWDGWASLPDARFRLGAAVVDDALYVVGGENLTRPPGDSVVVIRGRDVSYGPPPNREFFNPVAASSVGDTLVMVTSLNSSRVLRLVDGDWIEPLGAPTDGSATAGVLEGRIHAFDIRPQPEHRVLFLETGEWRTAPPPPVPVDQAAVVEYGGSLYVIGGADDQDVGTRRVQVFTPGG
ncbi:MAG: hypothetical protein HKN73_18165 [Gemmatimonadetes bacterium]|nr:hypothetical protein [Gemmatimonadota bacterium]